MPLRTLLLLMVVALLAVFTVLSWNAFGTSSRLSLAFSGVQAPLGPVMLDVTAMLCALFLLHVAHLPTTVLLDARRSACELHAQRELANKAEASRFTTLQALLETRLQKLEVHLPQRRLGPRASSGLGLAATHTLAVDWGSPTIATNDAL
jgi:hypothetical protein